VTGIAIYIEGGGDSTSSKAQLRQGFDALLEPQKNAARARKLHWKLVLCGGRAATCDAFLHAARTSGSEIVVLLVDAEEPVVDPTPAGRAAHLAKCDGWNLDGVSAEQVHLMTQCMEAWISADGESLAAFYGKDFHRGALSKRKVLDEEPKASLYAALEAATKGTQKGSYGKIGHASELLKRIKPAIVATRCQSFQDLTSWLDEAIAGAGV
jgi:hypothetical protein